MKQCVGLYPITRLDRHRSAVARRPLLHHRAYGSVRGESIGYASSPSDLKYALESPTERALARARYQGPRWLPAVLLANRGRTPSASSATLRRCGVFQCRHSAAPSRNRTQRVRKVPPRRKEIYLEERRHPGGNYFIECRRGRGASSAYSLGAVQVKLAASLGSPVPLYLATLG